MRRRWPLARADDDGVARTAVRGSVFRASLLTFAVGPCALVAVGIADVLSQEGSRA